MSLWHEQLKNNDNEGKQNSDFLKENLQNAKILAPLQIYVRDELLDQNG